MFGLGKKARAAEAVRRGIRAAFTGAYFHHTEVEAFGLNDTASAWLYTEALAHFVYALGYVSSAALAGKERWATLEFFFESAVDGMKESERDGGPSVAQLAPVILKRYAEFEEFSGKDRNAGAHYRSSAKLVCAQDPNADLERISSALQTAVENYVHDIRKMFDV